MRPTSSPGASVTDSGGMSRYPPSATDSPCASRLPSPVVISSRLVTTRAHRVSTPFRGRLGHGECVKRWEDAPGGGRRPGSGPSRQYTRLVLKRLGTGAVQCPMTPAPPPRSRGSDSTLRAIIRREADTVRSPSKAAVTVVFRQPRRVYAEAVAGAFSDPFAVVATQVGTRRTVATDSHGSPGLGTPALAGILGRAS